MLYNSKETVITHLSTYHDLRAISIIRSFVAQTGYFFGADETQMHQLELAAEEASAFIINALKPDKDKLFEIDAKPIESGLRFCFHSKGMPIDEENLPTYDSRDPEASIDGLPFFLLENLSDAMWFKNEGNNGWILVFEKRFHAFKPLEEETQIDDDILNTCAKERLKISIAKPEDAYDIIKLTYLTYRYSYAKSVFYYRKELENAISSGEVIIFAAKNSEGEVVVSSAYLRSKHSSSIAEAGMLMSKPEYRKNSALLFLSRKQSKFLNDNDQGIKVAYVNLVTTHTRSQRLTGHFGYIPTALKLSIHDRANFIGIDVSSEKRESLLYSINIPYELNPTTIFLPKNHLDITKKLLENFKYISFSTECSTTKQKESKIETKTDIKNSYANITIEIFGENWIKDLKQSIKNLRDDGIITIYINIFTDKKLPLDFEKNIEETGAFYSGIMMKTTDKWELLYTILQGQHFDFDSVKLHDKKAIELKDYMHDKFINAKL